MNSALHESTPMPGKPQGDADRHSATRTVPPSPRSSLSVARYGLAVLTAFLLAIALGAPAARAGHYVMTSQTGGKFTAPNQSPVDYAFWTNATNQSGYGGQLMVIGKNADAAGNIVTTFTWQADPNIPNDVPPPYIIVHEQCEASASAPSYTGGINSTPVKSNNGLGGTEVLNNITFYADPTSDLQVGTYSSVTRGSKYSLQSGSVITVNCSPSASVSGDLYYPDYVAIRYTVDLVQPYFSGTNCMTDLAPPDGFTGTLSHLTIKVAGTTVYDGAGTPPGSVHFDSTNFPDDTLLEITSTATSTAGLTFNGNYLGHVYNKYSCLFMDSPPFTGTADASNIPDKLSAMNHSDTGDTGVYTRAKFLDAMAKATAMHFMLHGSPYSLGPIRDYEGDPEALSSDDIANAYAARNNKGIPGFNVVFAMSCNTLGGGVVSIPTGFGIQSGATDRAYVGFDAKADGRKSQYVTQMFWEQLRKGHTVAYAVRLSQMIYNKIQREYPHPIYPANLTVVGDSGTTLHQLYGTKPGEPWYRVTH